MNAVHLMDLDHRSAEFDAAYDLFAQDIPPEFLETREFLINRLRVRDEGPTSDAERLLVQDGYTLHLVAALDSGGVAGSIYGHLISGITAENRAVGFVTYIAVHAEWRRRGIGSGLIRALQKILDNDARRETGQPLFGMVYEIEKEGKQEIKAAVTSLGARPLDIVYYQPALRLGSEPEKMDLWFQPVPPLSPGSEPRYTLPAAFVADMVRNMLTMEYVGPELKGFDLSSKAFASFSESIKGRAQVGFRQRK